MHADARRTCKSHPKKGQTKNHVFAQVLQKNPTTVYEPIKKNKDPATAGQSKQKLAKEDCWENVMCKEYFQYVYQPFPATLSDDGKPYACQKSQLASSLETYIRSPDQEPDTDVIII